jgi:hypothetical protein
LIDDHKSIYKLLNTFCAWFGNATNIIFPLADFNVEMAEKSWRELVTWRTKMVRSRIKIQEVMR